MNRKKKTQVPEGLVNQPRFASDVFRHDLTLNKGAFFVHPVEGNVGATQGSGPMMFFVGAMGYAPAQVQAMYGPKLANMTPGS